MPGIYVGSLLDWGCTLQSPFIPPELIPPRGLEPSEKNKAALVGNEGQTVNGGGPGSVGQLWAVAEVGPWKMGFPAVDSEGWLGS